MRHFTSFSWILALLCPAVSLSFVPSRCAAESHATEPLHVVATLPDLGDLAKQIGGDLVEISVIVKGPEDPHFAEPKPSYIKALSRADVLLQVGLDLEIGYVPLLLQNARNAAVLPSGQGYLDLSVAVKPIQVPGASVDRSMGDVHALGNPHYLLDPINGLRVAAAIRDRFSRLRPRGRNLFSERYTDFSNRVGIALVGSSLAKKYDAAKLALLFEHGKLAAFLEEQGDAGDLGGWLEAMMPHRGGRIVDDHRVWPYFARRFGVEIFGDLEPLPGVPPTTKHLTDLVARMRAADVHVIVTLPYYDPRHARFVAQATSSAVVPLAHQVGAVAEATDYLAMIDYNVRRLARALQETEDRGR